MGGHRDDVEPDQTSPVISISMCNDAIFLLGGTTKDIEPIPIRLHSGDIMIMSGSSRRAVHGLVLSAREQSSRHYYMVWLSTARRTHCWTVARKRQSWRRRSFLIILAYYA